MLPRVGWVQTDRLHSGWIWRALFTMSIISAAKAVVLEARWKNPLQSYSYRIFYHAALGALGPVGSLSLLVGFWPFGSYTGMCWPLWWVVVRSSFTLISLGL